MSARIGNLLNQAIFGFEAIYSTLKEPRVARRVIIALLAIHTVMLATGAYVQGPTLNEPGHLVAGLSHWEFGRFELYRVNPPLVRMIAAVPVMAVGYAGDWNAHYEGAGARPELELGKTFVRANGERSLFLFTVSRWACIPFSWLGATICYLWARDLYGRPAGLFACAIWTFEPNILAHASLITPDAHATALGISACYAYWRWLKDPSWTWTLVAGVGLGFAELAKTTLIVFYPLSPLLWLGYRWGDRKTMRRSAWRREIGMLVVLMTLGLNVLNLGYGFEGSFRPLKDFCFVSELFSGCTNADTGNRFADSWLGNLYVPFPRHYVIGLDIQQFDFQQRDWPSYLNGSWSEHGWWYYYAFALAFKVPLALWFLIAVVLIQRISNLDPQSSPLDRCASTDASHNPTIRDEIILLAPSLVIFLVASCKTGFSEHMRYVLPCFPAMIIWTSQIVAERRETELPKRALTGASLAAITRGPQALRLVPVFCLAWLICSSVWIFPHSLSYFNELSGGPTQGHRHLVHSNIDWGQDIRLLQWWQERHRDARPFYLAYFGGLDPADIGVSSDGIPPEAPTAEDLANLPAGWYGISINLLRGYPWTLSDGNGRAVTFGPNAFAAFQELEFVDRVGYSIYIYRIKH